MIPKKAITIEIDDRLRAIIVRAMEETGAPTGTQALRNIINDWDRMTRPAAPEQRMPALREEVGVSIERELEEGN